MSTDDSTRAKSNDIDATVSYLNGNVTQAQDFQRRFYDNLRASGVASTPDITLFVDEADEGKTDFYRGRTGNYFFYTHSKNNNPNSLFDISLDGDDFKMKPSPVDDFWTRRGKKVPDKIGDAHLFVEDNALFLGNKFGSESDLVKKALTVAKYLDRVEDMLKDEIERQWGKKVPVPEHLRQVVEVTDCLRRYFIILDADRQPDPNDKGRIASCLGARSDEELRRKIADYYRMARLYFKETEQQVRDAEDDVVTPSDEVPSDIVKNTGQIKVTRYYVFVLTNSSDGLYVGSEESLQGAVRCGFTGGGINCKPSDFVTYRKIAGPFRTHGEAQSALCKGIRETHYFPLGIGLKGKWADGKWYGLWNASVRECPRDQ
jgi:hypothetical protein